MSDLHDVHFMLDDGVDPEELLRDFEEDFNFSPFDTAPAVASPPVSKDSKAKPKTRKSRGNPDNCKTVYIWPVEVEKWICNHVRVNTILTTISLSKLAEDCQQYLLDNNHKELAQNMAGRSWEAWRAKIIRMKRHLLPALRL